MESLKLAFINFKRVCMALLDFRQGRTPVDEALGRPYQDEVLAIVNSYGKVTDRLDDNDDPESGEYEMEEQNLEAGNESDPELKPYKYDKYGTG